MQTTAIEFHVPTELLLSLNKSADEFALQSRIWSALQLFKQHAISLGKAAELADISIHDFMLEASSQGIAVIDYDGDELEHELETLKELFSDDNRC